MSAPKKPTCCWTALFRYWTAQPVSHVFTNAEIHLPSRCSKH